MNSYSILIAEDDPFLAKSINHILQDISLKCKIVHSGGEVLDEYMLDYYDLVLMDIMLPDMDGFKTASAIRKANSQIPIIAFTCLDYDDIKSNIANSGINHYLQKPTNPVELKKLLLSYFCQAA